MRTTIDFGIDLGTTNSSVAVIDDIDAKVIPNKNGSGITPSAVWIDKRGNTHVGEEAKLRALVEDLENADLEFKQRMGDGPESCKLFVRSGRKMLPEELSAEVLKTLRLDVRTNMAEEIRAAVITVPAAFENPATAATRRAAELAGFVQYPLLLEPVAASLAYGFQSQSDNVYWFVYDLGGGTFDAAVMRIRDGLIQVVNHGGDNHLGGKLIDWDIVTKYLAPALNEQFNLPDFRRGNPRWSFPIGKLKYYAERAKIEVCRSKAPFEIWIEDLCEDADGNTVDFCFELTPDLVREASAPYIAKSLDLCRKTLSQTKLSGSDMERILMVGGSTLNPWVREAVEAELGGQVEFGIDPVTVVARGAAIFASTQPLPPEASKKTPSGVWSIQIEHKPVGNVPDPDIGGRVTAPSGKSVEGCTIELVDTKTHWRSGRITLGADGTFMTQLFAESSARHHYDIELCDGAGNRLPTVPDRVSYTVGVIPEEHPPAVWSIGVGLANGRVANYVKKGMKLPLRKSLDHLSTQPLRAGHAEDELRIPILEGENPRAERNHGIGTMIINGSQIKRDLPAGSPLEITLLMDTSQQIRLQVLIDSLDEDFEAFFDPVSKHSSLEELEKEAGIQKQRLETAREKAEKTDALKAKSALGRINDQRMVAHIDSLIEAAGGDSEATKELDRRLRELAAAIDEVEDAVEWPTLLEKAEESRREADRIAQEYGESRDRHRLRRLFEEAQSAVDEGDHDLLRRCIEEIDYGYIAILERRPEFHVARFNWLAERIQSMREPAQAELLLGQGRRAINTNDLEALKAANRQLLSLLPREIQEQAQHGNIGGTLTRQ